MIWFIHNVYSCIVLHLPRFRNHGAPPPPRGHCKRSSTSWESKNAPRFAWEDSHFRGFNSCPVWVRKLTGLFLIQRETYIHIYIFICVRLYVNVSICIPLRDLLAAKTSLCMKYVFFLDFLLVLYRTSYLFYYNMFFFWQLFILILFLK